MDTALDLTALQVAIQAADVDGWLWYDFKGLNPFPAGFLDLKHAILTRRWFLYLPAHGAPVLIHHRIEATGWETILPLVTPVQRRAYASHDQLSQALRDTLAGARRIAMEYSPQGAVPGISYVDAGTFERVRACGVEIVSSADLLQQWLTWSPADRQAHAMAVQGLVAAKDEAFDRIRRRLKTDQPVTEVEVQQGVSAALQSAGLITDHAAIIAFGRHASLGHYAPDERHPYPLQVGECVLIDLWAGLPDRPMADITWVGYAGDPPAAYVQAWAAVRDTRDLAVRLLTRGEATYGWEVDRAARDYLIARGYPEGLRTRLGHSLGRNTAHGTAVNLDDWETHDTRRLLPGLGVTVEPGLYPGPFGLRSEVNVFLTPGGAEVTTPVQTEPYWLTH